MGVDVEIFVTGEGVAAREVRKSVTRQHPTVTWSDPSGTEFEIVFVAYQPFDPPGGSRQPVSSPSGPFSIRLVSNQGSVTDNVRANAPNGTYFYVIHRNNTPLEWLRPIGTSSEDNFGGVEVHDPPPVTLPAIP